MRLIVIISRLQWRNLSLIQVKSWGYTVSQGKCQVVPKPGCWSPWPWHGMITGLQSGVIRSSCLCKYKQQTHTGTCQKIKAFQLLIVFKISFLTDSKWPEYSWDTVSQLFLETWRISLSAFCTAGTDLDFGMNVRKENQAKVLLWTLVAPHQLRITSFVLGQAEHGHPGTYNLPCYMAGATKGISS